MEDAHWSSDEKGDESEHDALALPSNGTNRRRATSTFGRICAAAGSRCEICDWASQRGSLQECLERARSSDEDSPLGRAPFQRAGCVKMTSVSILEALLSSALSLLPLICWWPHVRQEQPTWSWQNTLWRSLLIP